MTAGDEAVGRDIAASSSGSGSCVDKMDHRFHLISVDLAVLAAEARWADTAVASRLVLLADGGGVPAWRGRALVWATDTTRADQRQRVPVAD